jgi:ketosteroid isomerase-like protein
MIMCASALGAPWSSFYLIEESPGKSSRDTPAMGSANLDLVRSIYTDWQRGDFSSNEWADEDIEFEFAGGPEPETWTGLAAMASGYRDWLKAWKDFRAEPERYLVIDDDRILVLVRNSGRGRVSGLEIEERSVANLFHCRGGKVTRIVVYLDRQLALAEFGLASEAKSVGLPAD